jgi:flavoprotein
MDDFTKTESKCVSCDECGEIISTSPQDKDRGTFNWCRSCGLVVDDHPMGRGISGLMQWLRFYRVDKSDMQKMTKEYVQNGLKSARLASIPLVESYLVRQIL